MSLGNKHQFLLYFRLGQLLLLLTYKMSTTIHQSLIFLITITMLKKMTMMLLLFMCR